MAPESQKNDVALVQNTALQVVFFIVIKIDTHLSGFDKQYLFGKLDLSSHRVVYVRLDHIANGAVHVAQLLREFIRSEKFDAIRPVCGSQDHGQCAFGVYYLFNHNSSVPYS